MAPRITHSVLASLGAIALTSVRAWAQDALPEPPPPSPPWYQTLHLSAFVDGYASVNYNLPRPQAGTNIARAYDGANGFELSWVGAGVSGDPAPVGGSLRLRFGPTAERRGNSCLSADRTASPCDGDVGLANVEQAYAAYKPGGADGKVEFRFGKLVSMYGAEVAEAQKNFDYTRGLLFRYALPWFYTGFMASWRASDALTIDALAVNGYNDTIDNNAGKTFGVRVSVAPSNWLELHLGWLGGPEQDDQLQVPCPAFTSYSGSSRSCVPDPNATQAKNYTVDRGGANQLRAWRHMLDLVARVHAGELVDLVLDANYGHEGVRSITADSTTITAAQWYAASLLARWEFATDWTAAGRIEALRDENGRVTGFVGSTLGSATLTLATRVADHLTLMLDNRADAALEAQAGTDVFVSNARGRSDHQITTTLGVIVSTD